MPSEQARWLVCAVGFAFMLEGAQDIEAHLEPALTFYEWIDLCRDRNPSVTDAIATLTYFHYSQTTESVS